MFGKIRGASASSLGSLELERPVSKILRDDPLSIYEVTLMKLKLGSQRELSSPSEQTVQQIETDSASSSSCAGVMKINADCSEKSSLDIVVSPYEEVMAIDTECSSGSVLPGSIDSPCLGSKKQQQNRNVSVLYLFSKFKDSRQPVVSSSCEDAMPIEDGCSESSWTNSSDCHQSLKSTEHQMDQECVPSLALQNVTLMKLKLDSQRELSSISEQTVQQIETDSASSSSCAGVMKINADCSEKSSQDIVVSPYEEVMAIDTECSSGSVLPGSIDSPCLGSKKQQQSRNVSVLYLFSKFKDSCRLVVSSSCEDTMPIEDGCSESSWTNFK